MSDMRSRRKVYEWNGPPKITVWTETVHHNGQRWLQHIVKGTDGGDGVVVIGISKGKVLLVRHFRPATGTTLVEFPRGFGGVPESGKAPQDHSCVEGARELQEETGLAANSTHFLGYIWPDSGLLGNKVAVICADVTPEKLLGGIDGEIDSAMWVSFQEMRNMIASGQVQDGITLAAYAMWSARGSAPAL